MKSSNMNKRDQVDHSVDNVDYRKVADQPIGVTDGGQPVVAEPGDGQGTCLDHMKDEGPSERIVPFKSAKTTFYADDSSAGNKEKYNRLWNFQHQWDNDSTSRRTHQDKINIAKALSTALLLPKGQKDRVIGIVDNLSGRRFNKNSGIYGLALGAIAYVSDQDARSLDDRILNRDEFRELCEAHGVDGWEACKKVKEVYREKTK